MREKNGELIQLYWEGRPDGYYVKGHVSDAEAVSAVESYYGDDVPCTGADIKHVWAKWVPVGEDSDVPEGCDFELRIRETQRAGWFKVTRLVPAADAKEPTHD